MGVPLEIVDVGGGLGVDYEGTRSRSHNSINYSIDQYAATIVQSLAEAVEPRACPRRTSSPRPAAR
jgi:arginine decarboxylase